MGCDVGQQMDRERGLWDAKLFDTQELYGVLTEWIKQHVCITDRP